MEFAITAEEKSALLADAREAITAKLENRRPVYSRDSELAAAVESGVSALAKPCGAFVTLHTTTAGGTGGAGAARRLRGCIGRMTGAESLEKTVR
ncbi:MAG: AMMECR1 family protein, partial [Treponema sp.]|nr:AMMECR1 family protein [Treponema sp.]